MPGPVDSDETEKPSGGPAGLKNDRREIFGWVMYDWANSAFSTTVVTALLRPYLTALAQAAVGENGTVLAARAARPRDGEVALSLLHLALGAPAGAVVTSALITFRRLNPRASTKALPPSQSYLRLGMRELVKRFGELPEASADASLPRRVHGIQRRQTVITVASVFLAQELFAADAVTSA